jgi:SAM-dependent methyltransferase
MNLPVQVTEKVREQYEALPYPPRDPLLEHNLLQVRPFCSLDQISFYGFEGRLPENLRVLIAGGGTGDATIYLAEQVKQYGGSVVNIDISETSTNIAKERAKIRKLDNIEWIGDSLLNLPNLNIGKFDYIDCVGVLHHLAEPQEGLNALNSVLSDGGVMGIMLYAKYGRAAIYQMQELLRKLLPTDMSIPEKIANAKVIIEKMPQNSWFKMDESKHDDHIRYGDSGLYDLLLHSNDKPFSVQDVYEFAEKSNLEFLGFVREYGQAKTLYDPKYTISDKRILDLMLALPKHKQHEVMELFYSRSIKTHQFYLAKTKRKIPDLSDLSYIPYFSSSFDNANANTLIAKEVATAGDEFRLTSNGRTIGHKKNAATSVVIEAIDNKRTLDEIAAYTNVKTEGKFSRSEILAEINKIWTIFQVFDWMFLRHKDSKPTIIPSTLQYNALKRINGISG